MADSMSDELLAAFLEDSRDVLEEWESVCLRLKADDDVSAYGPLLRCAHNLKGSAGLTGLTEMHHKLHQIEDYLVKIRDQGMAPNERVVSVLLEVEGVIRRWVEGLKRDSSFVLDISDLETKLAALTARSDESAGHGSIDEKNAAEGDEDNNEDEDSGSEIKGNAFQNSRKIKSSKASDETLRVSTAKLDHLIQLVGEISLHQSIIDRASREGTLDTPAVRNVLDLKTKLTQDLQDAALSLRMIPVAGLFQKIERVARETAARLNKQIFVSKRGDEVTLDKLVVEGMFDPLIHIARNAVDHGIEASDARLARGKPERGSISLSADHSTAGVTITFEDDGNGIDSERIFKKAIEKALITPDQNLTEEAKLQLIFLPGLSTAENVTEISGRGVGMDVVAEAVKRMAGRLEVESTIGKGTRFIITLPTNLSIVDALVVRVDGSQYAVPTQDLSEVIDLRDYTLNSLNAGERRAVELRGEIVPVERMSAFLTGASVARGPKEVGQIPMPAIVIEHLDNRLALIVDGVIGQQQIFVRPVTDHLSHVGFYGGSTILSDGEPSIILDLPEMASRFFMSNREGSA